MATYPPFSTPNWDAPLKAYLDERDVLLPGSAADTSLSATYAARSTAPSAIAALPRFVKAVRTFDDSAATTLRVIGLGSSVGLGPEGVLSATNSASRKVYDAILTQFNRLSNKTIAHTNGSVGGSIITGGYSTDYATAKTAAGGAPNLVVWTYGMNDGQSSQYHSNQTYPNVYATGRTFIEQVQGEGADVVILTTPHPHTGRNVWTVTGGLSLWYAPNGGTAPATTYPTDNAAGSIVNVISPSGATVPASYRHLRVNEALRQLASDTGSVLIDVEAYWFDAVARYGQDALFTGAEYVHPNLTAFQQTYHLAISDFFGAMSKQPNVAAPLPAQPWRYARKSGATSRNTTTTLADDPHLIFTAGPNQVWEVEYTIIYSGPTAADLRVNVTGPSPGTSTVGRYNAVAVGLGATVADSETMTARSNYITGGSFIAIGAVSGTDTVAYVKALVRTGATGGVIAFQWAQDVSNGTNTTVAADSFMVARQLS